MALLRSPAGLVVEWPHARMRLVRRTFHGQQVRPLYPQDEQTAPIVAQIFIFFVHSARGNDEYMHEACVIIQVLCVLPLDIYILFGI